MAGVLRPPYLFFKGDFVMKKYKYLLAMAGLFLVIYLSACSESEDKPPTPNPPVVVDDGKTYLKIENNTPYVVNVYINDPPLYGDKAKDTIKTVPKKEGTNAGSNQWEQQPPADGRITLFFEYLIPIGSSVIPFYPKANAIESIKVAILKEGEVNTESVSNLPSPISTDSIFVLVRNNTEQNIWVEQSMGTGVSRQIYPFNAKDPEIAKGGEAVYIFENVTSLNGFTIGPNARKNFPNTPLEKGRVYSFFYDAQDGPQLIAQDHFDPSMADKIWTIPTSVETGKYFRVGLLQPRTKVEDGYILVGKSSYNKTMVLENRAGSQPYFGAIAPNGDVTERKIILQSNPSSLFLSSFTEDEDEHELIFTGQAFYESTDGTPFILITDYNGGTVFYMDNEFLKDIDENTESKFGWYIAKDKDKNYAIGGELYNYDTGVTQVYLDKVTRKSFDSAECERLWIQPPADCSPDSAGILFLAYDDATDAYIVVTSEESVNSNSVCSLVYIIDARDGSQKPVRRLDKYYINKIFQIEGGYYAVGTYCGEKYQGFIRKLNLEIGDWDWTRPQLVDSPYLDGASMIYNAFQDKDGSLILSGACVTDVAYQETYERNIPWLVKYDLNNRKKFWERVYEDEKYLGYYTYSTHSSSIGSYLLELYNYEADRSILVSTDLLGNISDDEPKPAIPRGAQFTVESPGSLRISSVLVPFEDAEMQQSAPLTLAKGDSAVMQVKGQWATYQWYVGGAPVGTTATYTFASAAREPGVYNVMVVVTDADDAKRSAERRIRVTN
jgi:hypothetical protein